MSTPQFFNISSPFRGVLLVEMNRYVYPVGMGSCRISTAPQSAGKRVQQCLLARTRLSVWRYCEGRRCACRCASFSATQAIYGWPRSSVPPHSEIGRLTERRPITVTEAGDLISTNEKQDASRKAIVLRDHILEFQNAISAIEKCPQPVIGAAHGVSFGLAIDILCACDIRYAASDARFSIKVVVIS